MSTKNYSLGQVGDYEIKQLKVFKAVVECGGFSAAETLLNIGRSTISLHISNLESRLSLRLCKRGRGGFALTEEGRVIYDMTERLLESLDAFRTTVNNLNSSLTGALRLVLSDTVCLDPRSHFPHLVQQFGEQAPEVTITNDVAPMAETERRVLNDEADIGFIPYHRKLDGLDYIHLYSDTCYLYCIPDHELVSLEGEELEEQINQTPATHAGLKPHQAVDNQLSLMNLAATAYYYEARLALILSGRYIGFLPEHFAQAYVDKGQLRKIGGETRYYQLGIAAIRKKSSQPNKPRDLFWGITSQHFRKQRSSSTPILS